MHVSSNVLCFICCSGVFHFRPVSLYITTVTLLFLNLWLQLFVSMKKNCFALQLVTTNLTYVYILIMNVPVFLYVKCTYVKYRMMIRFLKDFIYLFVPDHCLKQISKPCVLFYFLQLHVHVFFAYAHKEENKKFDIGLAFWSDCQIAFAFVKCQMCQKFHGI